MLFWTAVRPCTPPPFKVVLGFNQSFIIRLIQNKTLNLKYTLLWFLTGVAILIVMICPQIANVVAELLGIHLPINAVFFIGGLFCLAIILSLTIIVSKQTERIRYLAQQLALLEKEVRKRQNE